MRFDFFLSAVLVGLLNFPALPNQTSSQASFVQKMPKESEAVHALNRLTYGPRSGDVEVVRKLGTKKWIDQQLHPDGIVESEELLSRLQPLESLRLSREQLVRKYPPPQMVVAYASGRYPLPTDPEQREMLQRLAERYKSRLDKKGLDDQGFYNALAGTGNFTKSSGRLSRKALASVAPQQVVARDLQESKLLRAVYSNRQLQDVLTDFWFNHFNVYLDKGADRFLVTSYERDAIRPNVLGKFRELLRATAESPAMLWYLDNWRSVSPDGLSARRSRPFKGKARGLNENYARELLELHTLGVDGGFTQKDVTEVARCFTGWTIREPYTGAAFAYNDRVHDRGDKVVLGVTIPAGGGQEDGLKVIDIVAHHPSTARFISRKMAQRFVADNPPEELISAMAATFLKKEGDLREVMKTLLYSKAFWSQAAYKSKIKSPFEMVASALRATGAELKASFGLTKRIGEFGQPLYRKVEPTGYSNTGEDWVNSGALLARLNFALSLARNELPGVNVEKRRFDGDPTDVARSILFTEASSETKDAIQRGLTEKRTPETIAGLVLGSPEFQRR